MVIKTSLVFQDHTFEGFLPAEKGDLESIIVKHGEFQQRGLMEEDKNFQQPIPYVIIVNPELHKVIAYQRGSSSTTSGEQRLYGKRSLGVGGHVELEFKDATNPLRETALQEIKEEIGLTSIDSLKVLGYLNDNSDPVGEVHVGIIYLAETSEKSVAIVDGELAKVDFFSPEEIDEIMNSPDCDVESRSRIARKAYKEFIG